jgi:hypothetical protein
MLRRRHQIREAAAIVRCLAELIMHASEGGMLAGS